MTVLPSLDRMPVDTGARRAPRRVVPRGWIMVLAIVTTTGVAGYSAFGAASTPTGDVNAERPQQVRQQLARAEAELRLNVEVQSRANTPDDDRRQLHARELQLRAQIAALQARLR